MPGFICLPVDGRASLQVHVGEERMLECCGEIVVVLPQLEQAAVVALVTPASSESYAALAAKKIG